MTIQGDAAMGSTALSAIEQQITFLHTHDLASTARFYEQILGLALIVDQGDCRVYRVTNEAYIGFCQRVDIPLEQGRLIFTLVTKDVDAWYAHLCEQNVSFEHPPEHNAKYGIYHCFLHDPNGYTIEIQRFDDPEWYIEGSD